MGVLYILSLFLFSSLDIHLWPPLERGCCASGAFDLAQHKHSSAVDAGAAHYEIPCFI